MSNEWTSSLAPNSLEQVRLACASSDLSQDYAKLLQIGPVGHPPNPVASAKQTHVWLLLICWDPDETDEWIYIYLALPDLPAIRNRLDVSPHLSE